MTMAARSGAADAPGVACIAFPGAIMTTSFVLEPQPFRRGPSPEIAFLAGIAAIAAVLILFVVGVTFFALAIAFPIAVPMAEAYHLPIRVADAALANRLAGFWWLFGGLSIGSFVAAAVVAVKAVDFVSPRD
jgi:hypothetical protein